MANLFFPAPPLAAHCQWTVRGSQLLHAWKWQSTQRLAAPAVASTRGYRNHLAGPSLQCVNLVEYVKPRLTAAADCPLKRSAKIRFA